QDGLAESGEGGELRGLHFVHFLDVAEPAYAHRIEHEAEMLASLEADHDDFRAALEWARSQPRDLLRLASSLGWFWHLRSHYREGGTWLEQAVALNLDERSHDRARAWWALRMILNWRGEVVAGRARLWERYGSCNRNARYGDGVDGLGPSGGRVPPLWRIMRSLCGIADDHGR